MNSAENSSLPAGQREEQPPNVGAMLQPIAAVSTELADHHVALDDHRDRLELQAANEVDQAKELHGRLSAKMLARLQAEIEPAYRLWQNLTAKLTNQTTGELLAAQGHLTKIASKAPPGLIDLLDSLQSSISSVAGVVTDSGRRATTPPASSVSTPVANLTGRPIPQPFRLPPVRPGGSIPLPADSGSLGRDASPFVGPSTGGGPPPPPANGSTPPPTGPPPGSCVGFTGWTPLTAACWNVKYNCANQDPTLYVGGYLYITVEWNNAGKPCKLSTTSDDCHSTGPHITNYLPPGLSLAEYYAARQPGYGGHEVTLIGPFTTFSPAQYDAYFQTFPWPLADCTGVPSPVVCKNLPPEVQPPPGCHWEQLGPPSPDGFCTWTLVCKPPPPPPPTDCHCPT